MTNTTAGHLGWAVVLLALLTAGGASAGFSSSVPVSAELATSMARSMFPQAFKLGQVNLFLSEPAVLFPDASRVMVRMRVQAYDHRPEQGVALSEEGTAVLSGRPGFDPATRQVLLFEPRLNEMQFDHDNAFTRAVRQGVEREWRARVSDPVRTELPPHPYIQPFRSGIRDIRYGQEGLVIQLGYE